MKPGKTLFVNFNGQVLIEKKSWGVLSSRSKVEIDRTRERERERERESIKFDQSISHGQFEHTFF